MAEVGCIEGYLMLLCDTTDGQELVSTFTMLNGTKLRCFYMGDGQTGNVPMEEIMSMEVEGVGEWDPSTELPFDRDQAKISYCVVGHGESKKEQIELCFMATSVEEKQLWVDAIHKALSSRTSCSDNHSAFTMDEHRPLRSSSSTYSAGITSCVMLEQSASKTEINCRLDARAYARNQSIGSKWRECLVVWEPPTVSLYDTFTRSSINGTNSAQPIESHVVVRVARFRSLFAYSPSKHRCKYGLRFQDAKGEYIELSLSENEQKHWYTVVSECLASRSSSASTNSMQRPTNGISESSENSEVSRDQAIPPIARAAMEGYVDVRSKKRLSVHWSRQYAVLIGTQWLLYKDQIQASKLNWKSSVENVIRGSEAILATDIVKAEVWNKTNSSPIRHKKRSKKEKEKDYFVVTLSTGSTMVCRVSTSTEREQWLEAIENEINLSSQTERQVAQAIEDSRAKAKERDRVRSKFTKLQSEAKRRSMLLREILEENTEAMDDPEETNEGFLARRASRRRRSSILTTPSPVQSSSAVKPQVGLWDWIWTDWLFRCCWQEQHHCQPAPDWLVQSGTRQKPLYICEYYSDA